MPYRSLVHRRTGMVSRTYGVTFDLGDFLPVLVHVMRMKHHSTGHEVNSEDDIRGFSEEMQSAAREQQEEDRKKAKENQKN